MTTTIQITSEHVLAIANGYRLQFEDAQDTWVLLYPEGMVKLNPTASHILQRCDGKASVQEIVAQLEAAFETTGLSDDVHGFLAIAREQHWITLSRSCHRPCWSTASNRIHQPHDRALPCGCSQN